MNAPGKTQRIWPSVFWFIGFLVLSMLPCYAQKPYAPRDTSDVILNVLRVANAPYRAFAPLFHVAALLLLGLILWMPGKWGRLVALFIAADYFIMIATGAIGSTQKYGFVVMTGAAALYGVLGIAWLAAAFRNQWHPVLRKPSRLEWGLCALALLAFWGPYAEVQDTIKPDFNPLLLITSPDFGMSFCFTTPVFLMGLILCYPSVPAVAFRIMAINGVIYGLFNLSHWFYPERRWMGVLHLPLLLIALYALVHPRFSLAPNTALTPLVPAMPDIKHLRL